MNIRGKPFQKGADPRRHKLTPTERQLGGEVGYMVASKRLAGDAGALAWLFRKVRRQCREKPVPKGKHEPNED